MRKIFLTMVILLLIVCSGSNTLAQSVTVENAGTTVVNGHYTYLTTYNSKPYFEKDDGSYQAVYWVWVGGSARWQISNPQGYAYYLNSADTPLPPQNGWIVCPADDPIWYSGGASTPVPTLYGDGTFPVELTSFTAIVKGKNVELKWNTATEVNNYGFEVERRVASDRHLEGDGHFVWSKIGFVEGSGTTNAPKSYSFVDANAQGKISYRLKQIDRDGQFEYSNVVEATVAEVKSFGLDQNYPNPFNPITMINYQLPMNSLVTLRVYHALGREVTTLVNEVKEAGIYTAQFDGSKLSSGMYFYRLQTGNFTAIKKLTLMK